MRLADCFEVWKTVENDAETQVWTVKFWRIFVNTKKEVFEKGLM